MTSCAAHSARWDWHQGERSHDVIPVATLGDSRGVPSHATVFVDIRGCTDREAAGPKQPFGVGEWCAGLERHGQRVDFYQHHLMGQVNEDGGPAGHGPAGDILLYEFCVDLVHGVKVLAAGQIAVSYTHLTL